MRVIKIGGRLQAEPSLATCVASAWRLERSALCIVHGGGDEISALQRALGQGATFIGGRRVTTAADIDLVRMALSGAANKRLVARLVDAGVSAVGISGEDASLIVARRVDDATLGFVGIPERVDARLARVLIDAGHLPVISPLARDASGGGGALNVNGDDAAAALAVALEADELLLLSDIAGVQDDHASPLGELDADAAMQLVDAGIAHGGMAAKLDAATRAVRGGVERVRIGGLGALLEPRRGTVITPTRAMA